MLLSNTINHIVGTCFGDRVTNYTEEDWTSSSDNSKISVEFLERVVDELDVQAVEDSTLRSYTVAWHGFNDFYIDLDNKDITWEHRLELYVAFMVIQKYQEAMIKSYKINWYSYR